MRFRRLLAGITVGAAVAALAACGSSAGSDGGVVQLKFLSLAYQPPTVAAVKKIVDDFNSSHPKIHVTIEQGSFDTANDQLTTQFQGGTAPDIIHLQASLITGFEQQGYLADLSPYLDPSVKSGISDDVWKTVSLGGKIFAAPTLLQSYVVFANTDQLAADGVAVPTGDTLQWDQFQSMATKLTRDGHDGLGWGLKSPAATVMNLSLAFGGKYFSGDSAKPSLTVGANEMQVPQRIKAMIQNKSLSATSVTQSGADSLPAFYAGKYSMVVGGDFIAQSIKADAPANFHWTVLPALAGTASAAQAADPQSLSVARQTKHVKEAAEFVNYYLQPKNLAAVAQGDWLIPTSKAARDEVLAQTNGADGWKQILPTANDLVDAPFQAAQGYPKWKTQSLQPALQKYLAGSLDDGGLTSALTKGWGQVQAGT
ncbi:MAG TPA: extracellular solute-binding protein [Rugosimonospora sp.]|jgi:ABC-type glycerol-3-phosphate transport system substrate-binding protein